MPDQRSDEKNKPTRRDVLRTTLRGGAVVAAGALGASLATGKSAGAGSTVWQIDPQKCTQCGNCATYCVLEISAVKCVHNHSLCGYCELCFGYFDLTAAEHTTAGENQLCPTGAILRKHTGQDPYYEYTIDEPLCVGCGKCIKGCTTFGNGSLFLQVRQDRCVNCNECAIAVACPAEAFRRVPADHPYLLKGEHHG